MPGACYAEVTYVPEEILRTPGAQAAARVHGIPDSEIAQGAAFPVSWARFLAFSEAVLNYAIHEASDSSEEDKPPLPRPLDDPPELTGCCAQWSKVRLCCLAIRMSQT